MVHVVGPAVEWMDSGIGALRDPAHLSEEPDNEGEVVAKGLHSERLHACYPLDQPAYVPPGIEMGLVQQKVASRLDLPGSLLALQGEAVPDLDAGQGLYPASKPAGTLGEVDLADGHSKFLQMVSFATSN